MSYSRRPDHDQIEMKHRATVIVRSLLQDSGANRQLPIPEVGVDERRVEALVALSGSLLSVVAQLGDSAAWNQTVDRLAEFVLGVSDTCADGQWAEKFALGLFEKIVCPQFVPSSSYISEVSNLVNPEEQMQDVVIYGSQKGPVFVPSVPLTGPSNASDYSAKPPSLDYDNRPLAVLGARFLSDVFGPATCPDTVLNYNPTIGEFINDVVALAGIERSVLVYALALLSRLGADTRTSMRVRNTFGLFITAYMISAKILRDDPFTNACWCVLGQNVFTLEEMNEMERTMFVDLEWDLHIDITELEEFEGKLYEHYRLQFQDCIIPTIEGSSMYSSSYAASGLYNFGTAPSIF